jgi:hypothetical protein
MSGIQFVLDKAGKETAVVIDLKRYRRVWEDFYDNLMAERRKNEPRQSWTKVKARLKRSGKLNG